MTAPATRVSAVARRLALPLAIVALGLAAAAPLLAGALPQGADVLLHYLRIVAYDDLISRGVWYSRWFPNLALGYGYPILQYYPPLPHITALLLHAVGASLPASLAWTFVLFHVIAAGGAYLWLRDPWGDAGGLLGAAAFVAAPYMLYNASARMALAEYAALAFVPWAVWAAGGMAREPRAGRAAILAAALAAIVLCHNITAMLCAPLLAAAACLELAAQARLGRGRANLIRAGAATAGALALGLALSAFFWLPAFLERDLTRLDQALSTAYDYRTYFLSITDLLSGPRQTDPALINGTASPSLGWPALALAAAGVVATIVRRDLSAPRATALLFAGVTGVVCTAMTLQASQPLWDALPLLHFVLYPFRFLGLGSLFIGALAAAGPGALPARLRNTAVPIGVAAILAYGFAWQLPPYVANPPHSAADIPSVERRLGIIGTTSIGEYLPRGVAELPAEDAGLDKFDSRGLPPGASVLSTRSDPLDIRASLDTNTAYTATIKQFMFEGWRAQIDGRDVPIVTEYPHGLIGVAVPAGRHDLRVWFDTTPLRSAANAVSAVGAIGLLALLLIAQRPSASIAGMRPVRLQDGAGIGMAVLGVAAATLALKLGVIDRTQNVWRQTRLTGATLNGLAAPAPADFGDALTLLGADEARYVAESNAVDAVLVWRAQRALDQDFSIFARVVGPQGDTVGSRDEQHPGGVYATSRWTPAQYALDEHVIALAPGTPPGRYALRTAVYPLGQPGARLPIAGRADPEALVATIEVTRPLRAATSAELMPMRVLDAQIDPAVRLIGVDLRLPRIRVGELLPVDLYWRALAAPTADLPACFVLSSEQAAERTLGCADAVAGFGTAKWRAGDMWRAPQRVYLPPSLDAGHYRLLLRMGGAQVMLGELDLTGPEHRMDPPQVQVGQAVAFADAGGLVGFNAPVTAAAGSDVQVALVWRAGPPTRNKYKVFVQLVDARGDRKAGQDDVPGSGQNPTTTWRAGEYVLDAHAFTVPADLPAGEYRWLIGMYDEFTQQRLATAGGDAQVVLSQPVTIMPR